MSMVLVIIARLLLCLDEAEATSMRSHFPPRLLSAAAQLSCVEFIWRLLLHVA